MKSSKEIQAKIAELERKVIGLKESGQCAEPGMAPNICNRVRNELLTAIGFLHWTLD